MPGKGRHYKKGRDAARADREGRAFRIALRRGSVMSVEMFLMGMRPPTIREMRNQEDADANPPRDTGLKYTGDHATFHPSLDELDRWNK